MLEKLQEKRAVLVAQRDQIMANYNLTQGAIAIIDELIGEALAEASQAAKSDAEPSEAAAAEPVAEEPTPTATE